jgi:hypothetical protein
LTVRAGLKEGYKIKIRDRWWNWKNMAMHQKAT